MVDEQIRYMTTLYPVFVSFLPLSLSVSCFDSYCRI